MILCSRMRFYNVRSIVSQVNRRVEVYVSRENTPVYTYPLKKLVAFKKVKLASGEKKKVDFTIAPRELSVWEDGKWRMLSGKYTLFIGSGQPGLAKGITKGFEVKIR